MRRIFLDRLRVQASIGILPHELESKQPLLISAEVRMHDAPLVPAHDDVREVLDYRRVRQIALDEVNAGHINMLESLAGRIAQHVLALPGVSAVVVRVDKPNIFPDCDGVAVEVSGTRPAA
ncbi:MAG TPA: dihydroneopterin aldolase [Burkholderiaceae bacterium]|nr:dihydroneopterin aldolase [Burkholderiaceae bacterium]